MSSPYIRLRRKRSKIKNGHTDNESGQILVIGLIVSISLFMVAITVANVGMMVAEKIHVQDTVDASAYSAAVAQARYMNLSAYVTRAMIANYNSMAFNTAVWATVDADDHGIAVIVDLMYKISAILFVIPFTTAFASPVDTAADAIRDYVHSPLHTLNHELNELFAQDDDADDLNQYIEIFNIDVLTLYQGLLYASLQSSRHEIIDNVAKKMDDDIITTTTLGLGAEAISYDELARAVDFIIRDDGARDEPFKSFNQSFNEMFGSEADDDDHPLLLAATTEASLDKFVAGRDRDGNDDLLRQFDLGNILPEGAINAAETALDVACYAACIAECGLTLGFSCNCNCNAQIELVIGSDIQEGTENKASETHVPFIARQRMREVNFFGLRLTVSQVAGASILNAFLGEHGHTSGDWKNDVSNFANASPNFNHGIDLERAFQCILTGCIPYSSGLNSMNANASQSSIPPASVSPLTIDDHWDGSFDDIEPVNSWEIYDPASGKVEAAEYLANVIAEGYEEGVPKYDWQVDLDNLGWGHYYYPETGSTLRPAGTSGGGGGLNNRYTGPSIAVVGVKKPEDIKNLRWGNTDANENFLVHNQHSITAVARSQVYYVRNPNRPNESPSLLNPHWVARLAPIDNGDTPALLADGLPFIASVGIPLRPTH